MMSEYLIESTVDGLPLRNQNNRPSAGNEGPSDVAEAGIVVLHMFKDVKADHSVCLLFKVDKISRGG